MPPSAVDPDIPVSPLAPRVRITIVPVNAAENNTVSSSPPATEVSSPIPIIEAGPTVVVTEPSPTPPAGPQIKSEAILTPIPPVIEADAQPFAEVEQGKVDSVEPETFSASKGPEPTLSVTGPEPVRAATESVTVPVAAEPAVEPETTTVTEAIPTTAPTGADVPAATKAQPESSTATESTTEPKATPAATEPFPAITKVPDETTAVREPQQITVPLHKPEVHGEGESITLTPADVLATIEGSTTVAAPVSDIVHVEEGLSKPGPVPVTGQPITEVNVDVAPLVEVLKAEDGPAIVVEEPAVEELVGANIVKDETPAPVVGYTSPVAVNETLAPESNPPTDSLIDATDTPIIVKGKRVTGGEYAAVAEPTVEEQVADTKLEEIKPNPEPIIEPVPTTVVENIKPVESLSVVQQSLREPAPVSQELVSEPSVEPTPVITEGADAVAVDKIKPVPPPEVTCEVGKPSASELKVNEVVEPIPTTVVTAVEAHAPPEVNEPVAPKPSSAVDEATLTKDHGQANGSTTTDPGDSHGALPAATASTREAVTHAEKFPSASTSHPVSEDNTPSSSKFNSTRKKRASLFGKLKNIFHQDKEKEKK